MDKTILLNSQQVKIKNNSGTTINPATEDKQDTIIAGLAQKTEPSDNQFVDILPILRTVVLLLANPAYVDKTANQIRAQITGSLTTLTTVTGLTNIDSQQGRQLIVHQNMNAWANNCRARIS